ncbi:MAG: hypothetical protein ACOYY3_07245 [Chloroflexota bacterium]
MNTTKSRIPWSILFVVTAMAILSLSITFPVQAATNCQGFAYNFTGTDPIPMTHWGIKAGINTKVPALCGASYSDSSVWVMMAGGGNCEYAQSGYGRHQGQSTVYFFAQYSKNCSTPVTHKETSVASGTHTYRAAYNFSTGKISMYVDTTLLLTTNFDAGINWTPGWVPQWEGETHDPGDDVPGSQTSRVYFSNMKIIASHGGPWVTPSGLTGSSTSSRYGFAWNSQDSKFNIWTK